MHNYVNNCKLMSVKNSRCLVIIDLFFFNFVDHYIVGPTKVPGFIWGKLCEESFASISSCSVHSQIV